MTSPYVPIESDERHLCCFRLIVQIRGVNPRTYHSAPPASHAFIDPRDGVHRVRREAIHRWCAMQEGGRPMAAYVIGRLKIWDRSWIDKYVPKTDALVEKH